MRPAFARFYERYVALVPEADILAVLGHLVDAERVFGYRAFCFSRGEAAALPSFDENLLRERYGIA